MNRSLGKIESVRLRDIWSSESDDFTPWLAESQNIELLASSLGLNLEVCAQEARVGIFRADILCKDVPTGTPVVIENQLEKSDHGHLGQLLTYASGLKAATIIWVAPAFCKEHLATLDWLNSVTGEAFNFFAVRIEVLKIGKSRAPKFTIVNPLKGERPAGRDTRRKVEAASIQSESAKTRLEYWQTFLSELPALDEGVKPPKPNSLGNLRFSLQGRDLWITVYAAASLGRIGVFLRGSEDFHSVLRKDQKKIQQQLGKAPRWYKDEDGWTIAISKQADPTCKPEWPSQHRWLATNLRKYLRAFTTYAGQND